MEELIKLQLEYKKQIERGFANYKKSPKDRLTESYCQTRLETLDQQWKMFMENHLSIVKGANSKDEAFQDYTEETIYESTEDTYIEYKSALRFTINKLSISSVNESFKQASGTNANQCHSSVKLPEICIPKFSGKYSEWPTFKDMFTSLIHNNNSLGNVQKIHYLKGYLTGEAEQLIRQIPVSDENYSRAWSMLNERFNNKKYMSHCIIKRLLSQRNIQGESAAGLKDLVDTTNDCLDALKNLKIDVSTWDILIIHILALKLDSETKKQWEIHVSSNVESDSLPTYEQFKNFMTQRYRALEFIEPNKFNKNVKVDTNQGKLKTFIVTKNGCIYCGQDHRMSSCSQFIKKNVDNRRDFVQEKRLCFNCLGLDHSARECKIPTRCKICGRLHHTLLHTTGTSGTKNKINDSVGRTGDVKEQASSAVVGCALAEESSSGITENITSCFSENITGKRVLLATAVIKAEANNGTLKLVRALLDQGSQASFVTESTVQYLGLKKKHTKSVISGLGGDKKIVSGSTVTINLQSRVNSKIRLTVKAYVLSKITDFLPTKKVIELDGMNLTGITLADPEYHNPNKIDILLGAEVYSQILKEGLRKDTRGSLIAQDTDLGWIISGTVTEHTEPTSNVVVMHSLIEENEILKRFWELENEPNEREENWMNEEEIKCEELYKNTVKRDDTGRYIVKIPFKVDKPKIQDSLKIAEKRFQSLEERFKKNELLKEQFTKAMDTYLSSEHMELVKDDEIDNPDAVYVPIMAVIREDRDTTQVRVVCDSSCKGRNGISINDLMMKGPVLQDDLRHLLMRWRTYPCCLVADIAKMYLQIKVSEIDIDYQRLLWRPNAVSAVKIYRMLRVSFGSAAAPYLAVRTLQQVAYDEGDNFPMAKLRTLRDFYVDDMMTGCDTEEEAMEIYKQMNELLRKGGFVLRKWTSNNDNVLKEIETEQGTEEKENITTRESNLNIKIDNVIKILGLTWNRREDEFRYAVKVSELDEPVTKRKILSEVARLFDPLGWLSPCIVVAKIILQKLWLKGLEWDEKVPADINKQWVTYQNELPLLKEFSIPRWMNTTNNSHIELHGFADASNVAYAAVIYARIMDDEDNIKVVLVTAKTKVCPIKIVSIPRLELCGAALLAKLLKEVANVLGVDRQRVFAWTDSTVVLAWLNSHPRRWKPFVANRVSDIITKMEPTQWAHVKSKENPADVASRGLYPSEILNCDIWKNGPEFLRQKEIKIKHKKDLDTNMEEIKVHHTVTEEEEEDVVWKRFSTLNRLVRVVAYCKRFIDAVKSKGNKPKFESYLTSKELSESLNILIKKCQKENFKEEMKDLVRGKEVKNKSKLAHLNPFLDGNNIMRVGGRLEQSKLTPNAKHPLILPKDSRLSKLIVEEAHQKLLHGGQQLVLGYLQSNYWIIGGKILVKGIIRKCITCIRHSGITKNQLMGQLPEVRVNPARAFLNTGVDMAGPVLLRTSKGRGHHAYKGYICLFICMATRAVHLEAVSDLTAEGFIAAFRRFVSRRGHCSHIWSDNGTNFVGASKELLRLFSKEQSSILPEIQEVLANNKTTWHFIPPYSPNFGGLWEAGIKSTKYHLKRVIGDSTLTYEELSTVLSQIEACLNSRPISRIDTDGDNYTVLTPGHFLVGEPLVTIPDQNFETHTLNSLRRWQMTQRMLQSFWSKWATEYLHHYLQRYKWSKRIPEPEIGDVVLVKELDLPPARWLIGRIIEKHPGLDGITRVVTLKAKNTVIKRPVSKLCVLPIET